MKGLEKMRAEVQSIAVKLQGLEVKLRKQEQLDAECSVIKSTQERDSADRCNSLEKNLTAALRKLELEIEIKAQNHSTELAQLQQSLDQYKDLKATSAQLLERQQDEKIAQLERQQDYKITQLKDSLIQQKFEENRTIQQLQQTQSEQLTALRERYSESALTQLAAAEVDRKIASLDVQLLKSELEQTREQLAVLQREYSLTLVTATESRKLQETILHKTLADQ